MPEGRAFLEGGVRSGELGTASLLLGAREGFVERRPIWSSDYGLMVDASESSGDEGRDKLR